MAVRYRRTIIPNGEVRRDVSENDPTVGFRIRAQITGTPTGGSALFIVEQHLKDGQWQPASGALHVSVDSKTPKAQIGRYAMEAL